MSKFFDSSKFLHEKFPTLNEMNKRSNFKKKKKELISCFFSS